VTNRKERVSILDLQSMSDSNQRIVMLTCYDYPSARLAERAKIPIILVGDTLGMVVLGYDSTLPVTLEDMIHHGKAVRRGALKAHVVVDLPFGSYQSDSLKAMDSAVRIMKETECDSVKLEGASDQVLDAIQKLSTAGIPVMGHIGLTPQSINALGGFKLQGRTPRDAIRLLTEAQKLEDAGAYALVLECIPTALAAKITEVLNIPTIGIGAGPYTNGQVQVWHDIFGLYEDLKPRHSRVFSSIGEEMLSAIKQYITAVETGEFPNSRESFMLSKEVTKWVKENLPGSEQSMKHAEQVLLETERGDN
jgi:3-methyl-2-oxobutanoate hydroxymethyltransferase